MKNKLIWMFWVVVFCCLAGLQVPGKSQDAVKPMVVKVNTKGESGNFNFSITLSTPDLGCEQYADWWEVVSSSGELVYRRILTHSHVEEQPFTRSGGPVNISSTDEVWIRVHMNNTGYASNAKFGSVKKGFESRIIPESFASNLDEQQPLPKGCRF